MLCCSYYVECCVVGVEGCAVGVEGCVVGIEMLASSCACYVVGFEL